VGKCVRATCRAVAQAGFSPQEPRVKSQVTSCEFRSGRSDNLSWFGFALLTMIPLLLHIHLSPSSEVCDSPDQAANYPFLGYYVACFMTDPSLASLHIKETSYGKVYFWNDIYMKFISSF
jgi:hypothetical protein